MRFRKKPVVIEAIRWDGNNLNELLDWGAPVSMLQSELIVHTLEDGQTGQAKHAATIGDWVVKGVKGEFYFCKPDIFEQTHEKVEEE